jgi:hypothetical protein
MPRGRPKSTVRYFFDEVAGAVIAVGQGAVRVLKEIGSGVTASPSNVSRRGGKPRLSKTGKRIGRPPKAAAAADPMAPAPAAPKKRGRKKKSA